jgi:putative transcriptional regulator
MNHWELENVVSLAISLKQAGFSISQICCSRNCCFDFAARKGNQLALVKVYSEVDGFSVHEAQELKVVADRTCAASLVAGQRTHEHVLEDDTVYMRHAVFVVTPKTLRNVAVRTAFPLVFAGPGGYYVEVNGKLIQQRRKELGFSVGRLAEQVGVSRRTLYGYEYGMAKASVASAYNLTRVLGTAVAKPVDILQRTHKQNQCLIHKSKQALEERVMWKKVFCNFSGCDITHVHRAPFDFVVNLPDENKVILGAVAAVGEQFLDDRVDEILSICKVIDAYPVLVTEKKKPSAKDIFCIGTDELSETYSPTELAASF